MRFVWCTIVLFISEVSLINLYATETQYFLCDKSMILNCYYKVFGYEVYTYDKNEKRALYGNEKFTADTREVLNSKANWN